MNNKCVSACIYCPSYKSCKKRLPSTCACGNNSVAVIFEPKPRKVIRKKLIGVRVECPECKEHTRTYSYEYQAVNAWNEMMRRAKK